MPALQQYTTPFTCNTKADVDHNTRMRLHFLYGMPWGLTRVIEDVVYITSDMLDAHQEIHERWGND